MTLTIVRVALLLKSTFKQNFHWQLVTDGHNADG